MADDTKSRLTVLHIFSDDLWAGAEAMVFNLLDQLKDDPDLKIIALSLNEGILTGKLRDAGIETYTIPEAANSFLKTFLKAWNLFKRRKIDIIHSHRYKENLLALLLAKTMGVERLVSTIHGLAEPPLKQEGENSVGLKTMMDYFLLRRYFSRVIAVSHEMKKVLVLKYRFREEYVDVIYNGIPLPSGARSLGRPADHRFQIGTVGRMVPVKDFDLFLEVAAEMIRDDDQVRFSILGDGPLKERLIRKARDLKIEGDVDFLSPTSDVFSYYQLLDLYLNTSHHEGIPLTILEAMACGKPVVAPSVGGVPEIVSHGEHGLLVEGREPRKFADSCLKLIQNKDLRITMGETASKRIVSCFDSFKMAECYRQLYRQSCKKF